MKTKVSSLIESLTPIVSGLFKLRMLQFQFSLPQLNSFVALLDRE